MVIRSTFCLLYVWEDFTMLSSSLEVEYWLLFFDLQAMFGQKIKESEIVSALKCPKCYNDMLVNFAIEPFNFNCIKNIVFMHCM